MMARLVGLNLTLVVAVVASAFFLVGTQYEARRTFMELEKSTQQARALDTEREVLEVEKREAASNTKVEQLARTKLGMHTSPAGSIRYVRVPATQLAGVQIQGQP